MLVPVPRRGPGLNSLLFYRKGGIAEAVTDEAGKGTLQKAQERQLLRSGCQKTFFRDGYFKAGRGSSRGRSARLE